MGLLGRCLIYGFAILWWINPMDMDAAGLAGRIDDIAVAVAAMYFAKKGLPKGLAHKLLGRRSKGRPADGEDFDPYEILLLPKGADRDRIMQAYLKQRAKYATDKASEMGRDFQRSAEDKLAKVEQAYQMLMRLTESRKPEDDDEKGQ